MPIIALTATATPLVQKNIVDVLRLVNPQVRIITTITTTTTLLCFSYFSLWYLL